MHRECIHAVPSWRAGPARNDCIFVEKDPNMEGFCGLYAAQVLLFFSFHFHSVLYPCALVQWFVPIGDSPCEDTGMWKVKRELDGNHLPVISVIHLDSVIRGAHLIGVYGKDFLPCGFKHTDSLIAFHSYFVNKYADYHANEIAF